MRKISLFLALYIGLTAQTFAKIELEPFNYSEDFEDRALGAWASYPLWQDTAYDPNFRVNEIVPGDPNISIVQKVTPYTNVDNYAGAQKLMNIYLAPGSEISLKYYLKTNLKAEFFKVRFAAGELGKLDITIPSPKTNMWVPLTVSYKDLIRENPSLKDNKEIAIHALALLTKIPSADPDMPIYLGLDDIKVTAKQAAVFKFVEPEMLKLPEFAQYIPKKHFSRGDKFSLSGRWDFKADKVTIKIASITDRNNPVYEGEMAKNGKSWSLNPLTLSYPDGLYIGEVKAFSKSEQLSSAEFTIHIAPKVADMAGQHPRLLYDGEKARVIEARLKEDRFKEVYDDIANSAKLEREKVPVASLVFDLDQFPDEVWLPSWDAWRMHIFHTMDALRQNAMAYEFHHDREAGLYVKDVLLKLSDWDNWSHPWQTKRGRFSEHNTGSWSHRLAEAYDLTYDLMSDAERVKIRGALIKNIIEGAYKTYVYNDNITSKTSNWIAMITGGSLMTMAAIYADGPDTENLEPYFTGTLLKYYTFLNRVADTKDGSWGEGFGYNNYSFSNLSYSVPSLNNVFNIDVSGSLVGTYNEYIWAGLIKDHKWFDFGDSVGDIIPASNWAFLLDMQKESRLGWYYNYLKNGKETFLDALFETKNVKEDTPFDESPVKAFHKVGTTVFKSGWDSDDFVFVMRSGPFYNHQHLDQGSFYLADRGQVFIEDRHLKTSDYYEDPKYQSWLTQPIAHSTILINGNHQSQRVGDPLEFAAGFDDHAFIAQFLDGRDAAFSSADIGRLYWGKVKSLKRNVLYLKPRTVLMVDIAVPDTDDVDLTLLYQTLALKDISVGDQVSKISKGGSTLNILPLNPATMDIKEVETPHYIKTLRNEKPLIKEGMITATSRSTGSKPLVMANILTTENVDTTIKTEKHSGFISGSASGQNFAFNTNPGEQYTVDNIKTDAVSLTWSDDRVFVGSATTFSRNGKLMVASNMPMTFELSEGGLKYYHGSGGQLSFYSEKPPADVLLNGNAVDDFIYNDKNKMVTIDVPKGEGLLVIQ
ncbi:MAG: heparinase II/III family protein [Alphaproteobacteria bacterium]|nr:heparinase II/III family protein [Alphaproteobacteria bacterium]